MSLNNIDKINQTIILIAYKDKSRGNVQDSVMRASICGHLEKMYVFNGGNIITVP